MKPIFSASLAVACLVMQVNPLQAETRFGSAFSPRLGSLEPELRYELSTISRRSVQKQDAKMSWLRQEFGALLPLKQSERFESALTNEIKVTDFSTHARLLNAGVPLPGHLWTVDFGGRVRKQLDSGNIAGLLMTFGSSSDKPFDSLSETSLRATGILQIPAGDSSQHVLFLNYATDSEFLQNVPLPGYAYQFQAGRKVQALLGVPFIWGRWAATEKLALQASYFLVRTVHAKISYQLADGLKVYSRFDWQNQRWSRAGRADHDDRLYYYEKKAAVGLQWDFLDNCALDLQGGFGFDRFLFEGEDYGDRRRNRISISDGVFLGAMIRWRF